MLLEARTKFLRSISIYFVYQLLASWTPQEKDTILPPEGGSMRNKQLLLLVFDLAINQGTEFLCTDPVKGQSPKLLGKLESDLGSEGSFQVKCSG